MRRLIAFVTMTLLAFGWAVSAEAVPLGYAFCKGPQSPQELADLVDASLLQDPTGRTMLDQEACSGRLVRARPVDYVDAWGGAVTLENLSAYLDSLEIRDAPPGAYRMHCLLTTTAAATDWHTVPDCEPREFNPGERAWFDPATDTLVLAEDCANPVDGEDVETEACAYEVFPTRAGDTAVRIFLNGETDLEDDCWGLKRAGEENFESLWMLDECPSEDCSGEEIEEALGTPNWRAASFGPNPGQHTLRVPRALVEDDSPWRVVFCIERWNLPENALSAPQGLSYGEWLAALWNYAGSSQITHSSGLGVQWFDYSDADIATIYYDEHEAVEHGASTRTGVPSVLWWHWPE